MSGQESAVRRLDLSQGFEAGVCERPPPKCYTIQKSVNAGNVTLTNGVRMVSVDWAGIAVETRPLAAGRKPNVALCSGDRSDRIPNCRWMAKDRLVCQIFSWQRGHQHQDLSSADVGSRAERRGREA
jgi:hypothetical protein